MPILEAPNIELGSAPCTPSVILSRTPSEISSASSPEPQNIRPSSLFRALAMPPPEPEQPPGQDELERRLPGYRRIVIPRELTLIELLKQCSGVTTDEEVLQIREAKLRVVAERVGLRRLHVLAPRLRALTLDGSAISSLRDLGIGLVHLKILSVNRCGLTSLDGVWGLGALRELHASGNRLQDLHPLAALQKLHTLDIANNPIEESSRLWTLGVCNSLRRLTLSGTPIADALTYRANVASVLPMLTYLDDMPLHLDVDVSLEQMPYDAHDLSSGSETAESENEEDKIVTREPQPGPSNVKEVEELKTENEVHKAECTLRRRPATTECAGVRPRVVLPARPRTAVERSIDAPARLQILNTLMGKDEEWRCSGSNLTSRGAVCGNFARALRRQPKRIPSYSVEEELELVEQKMDEACRALAAEIPRAPNLEDWNKFKQETGIEIDIDFNERPKELDPTAALERLERIEKETMERINNEGNINDDIQSFISSPYRSFSRGYMNDNDMWNEIHNLAPLSDPPENVEDLFHNLSPVGTRRIRRRNSVTPS